jgi:hypothetical protein
MCILWMSNKQFCVTFAKRTHAYTHLHAYKNTVRTSQETHYVSSTEIKRLMLFRETVAVYCEKHTEHTNTLCGQNAES